MTSDVRLKEIAGAEWAGGWRVVLAASCGVGTSWHFFQIVAGLFIIPMQTELGWSRSQVAIGPIGGMISIFFYPFAGLLIDRYGPRRIALFGLALLSLGLLMIAAVPANRIIFYCVTAYLAIVGSISNQIVFAKGVATWFARRFGTAIGLMMTGVTITSALGIPVLARVIAHAGWRAGFLTLAAIVAVIGIPVNFLWFRARRAQSIDTRIGDPVPSDVSVLDAVRDKRFWALAAAIGCAALPIGGFLSHLQPLLLGRGISVVNAAACGSVFVIAIGAGRIIVGMLLDRVYPNLVAAASLGLSGIGVLLLAYLNPHDNPWSVIALATAMIGLAQGAESDYISFFTLRIFGVNNFSKLLGLLSMVVGGGMAIGGFLFAALFDHFGNYQWAVRGSAVMFFLAALTFAALRVPRLSIANPCEMPALSARLSTRTP